MQTKRDHVGSGTVTTENLEELRVYGETVTIKRDDDRTAKLVVGEEEIVELGAPGVFGLLWVPL